MWYRPSLVVVLGFGPQSRHSESPIPREHGGSAAVLMAWSHRTDFEPRK